jgi:hypothetical protein
MGEQLNLTIDKQLKSREESSQEIPEFKTKITLSKEEKERIVSEIIDELEAIEKERGEIDLEETLDRADRQYDGEMQEVEGMQFNLSSRTTKIKTDAIVQALMDAFFDNDRVFSMASRPGKMTEENGGHKELEAQEDFIDYKVDETIPLEEECEPTFHSAVLKGVGILKIVMRSEVRKRKMDEFYPGVTIDPASGKPNDEGLRAFLNNHPEAKEKYPKDVERLLKGKDLSITVSYDEVVYDDPLPKFVDPKNLYVRVMTNKLEGLRDALLIAEKKEYTYWELKQEEKRENLENVDDLLEKNNEGKAVDGAKSKKYELFECTFFARLKETEDKDSNDDYDDYIKCVFHINREKKTMHDAVFFPYYTIDTNYIPFYIRRKKQGFYEDGVANDLASVNIAENVILNTTLEGAYISNIVTPIVKKDSNIAAQFFSKEWTHGVPLEIEQGEKPDFLSKYMQPINSGSLLQVKAFLRQEGAETVGVSESFATGRADPIDPQAPASKTIALLERSGLNVKQYIKRMLPSMNEVGNVIIQMYAQQASRFRKKEMWYRANPERSGGGKAFMSISRDALSAKSNAQSQALSFNLDRLNEKREAITLFQLLRSEPTIAKNPWAVYQLGKQVIGSFGYYWKNNLSSLWPDPQKFNQMITQVAMQAISAVIQQTKAKAQLTGQQETPSVDLQMLIGAVQQAVGDAVTPPSPEEVKQRQEAGNVH